MHDTVCIKYNSTTSCMSGECQECRQKYVCVYVEKFWRVFRIINVIIKMTRTTTGTTTTYILIQETEPQRQQRKHRNSGCSCVTRNMCGKRNHILARPCLLNRVNGLGLGESRMFSYFYYIRSFDIVRTNES